MYQKMSEAPNRDSASLRKVGMRVGGLLDLALGAQLVIINGIDWSMPTDKAETTCCLSSGTLLRQQYLLSQGDLMSNHNLVTHHMF